MKTKMFHVEADTEGPDDECDAMHTLDCTFFLNGTEIVIEQECRDCYMSEEYTAQSPNQNEFEDRLDELLEKDGVVNVAGLIEPEGPLDVYVTLETEYEDGRIEEDNKRFYFNY